MRSKSWVGSYPTLVSSSTHMPRRTHCWWPDTISYNIHKKVSYRPTRRHTKLLSFGISCLVCVSTFKCLFIQTQPMWALTNTCGGYHLRSLNFRSDHSSSFPSSILPIPLIAPPGLQLCQYLEHPAKPHRTFIDRKGPIVSGFQPLDFYRCLYNYA
jgi:hypothetical protein